MRRCENRSTEKVKLAIFIGAARDKMRAALDGATRIEVVEKLADAVTRAAEVAVSWRHRAALAGMFQFRPIQGLCGAR